MSEDYKIDDFKKILEKLEAVLKAPKSEMARDSAIKRFELCFELAWKSIQQCVKRQGLECRSPADCFRTAFQLGLIKYDQRWVDELIKTRNLTVHTYFEPTAEAVYRRLPEFIRMFQELRESLQRAMNQG